MMTAQSNSRGHLYGANAQPVIRVSLVIVLFTLAYAVVVFAVGVVPLNILIGKLISPNGMQRVWWNSLLRLVERTAIAAAACWLGLALTGRIRGRLTGPGMLALGATMSGALAGAVDVGLQRHWVAYLIKAAQASPARGTALSSAITAAVSLLVTLLLITRSTRALLEER
jgi:hypothetical protein